MMMKLINICPELRKIKKDLINSDSIVRVIYGREDRAYKICYKSGRILVTRHPRHRVLSFIKLGNVSIQRRIYLEQ